MTTHWHDRNTNTRYICKNQRIYENEETERKAIQNLKSNPESCYAYSKKKLK